MSVTTDLTDGLAALIAATASPAIAWKPAAAYASTDTGLYRKTIPASPDRGIAITVIPQGDNPSQPYGQVMIQLKGRGLPNNPTDVDDLLDSVFAFLHGATNLVLGSVTVIQINRGVRVPMGQDDSKRWELIDQYYADLNYPPTSNRPYAGSW